MTKLTRPVSRMTNGTLDGSYGSDRDRRIAVTLLPNDMIELRPERTRRGEKIALIDVYRYAIRCRVNVATLEKARARNATKATYLAQQRQKRAEKRLIERPV